MTFTVRTTNPYYKAFNGAKCKIVNDSRDDGLVEVFLPAYQCMILLRPDELED